MMKYLLDTSIVVFLFRGKYNIGKRLRTIGAENCCISDVTVAELTYGAYHSDSVQHNLDMIANLAKTITVIPFSQCVAEYGRQKDLLIKQGKMIEDFDLLIGCTGVACDLIVVTDNTKHFSRIKNIHLENWVER